MAREGTRSSTGHAAPRQFQTVDTAPTIKRKPATKKAAAKPTGVTKKTAPKKENGVVKKVCCCADILRIYAGHRCHLRALAALGHTWSLTNGS